jgi:dihydroflavonol-4-reductase
MTAGVALVTGASGFLGRHLVGELAARGRAPLRALVRHHDAWQPPPGVDLVCGDVLAPNGLQSAMDGVSQVYHLAGRVARESGQASALFRLHVEGARNVCRAAASANVEKALLVSSSGTIAVSPEPLAQSECAGYKPEIFGSWPYYASKMYAEKLALQQASAGGVPVVVVGPALVLGPGDGRGSSTGDVARCVAGHVPVAPRGGLSFVDVRDVADGLIAAMERARPGQRYFLGGENWTFRRFFGEIARLAGRPGPRFSLPPGLARASADLLETLKRWRAPVDPVSLRMSSLYWYVDSTKARQELGFVTRPAVATLRDTVEALQRQTTR